MGIHTRVLAWLCLLTLLAPKGLLLALCLCDRALTPACCAPAPIAAAADCCGEHSSDEARLGTSCERCYEVATPDWAAARWADAQPDWDLALAPKGLAFLPLPLQRLSAASRPVANHAPPPGAAVPLRI